MGLTSSATLALFATLAIAAPLACLLVWNRLGYRMWVRGGIRSVLLLLSQASAVLLVGLLINNQYAFYISWGEIFGQSTPTVADAPVARHQVERIYDKELRAAYLHGHGTVIPWVIPGTSAGLPPLHALVYLPAAYGNPAARGTLFPVVELLGGVPGRPETWLGPLKLKLILDERIASGQSMPFIAVLPTQNVQFPHDTQCVNVVGGPQVDTYLSEDVHRSVIAGLRANPNAAGWATMGYSTGGYCAMNLAMRHPNLFAAAASLSGYAQPAKDHSTGVGVLFGGSAALRNRNTPLWEAAHWGRDNLSILAIASRHDGATYNDTVALAALAHAPLRVSTILLKAGGHNARLWVTLEPVAFNWLSQHVAPPLANIVINGRYLPHLPSSPGQPCQAAVNPQLCRNHQALNKHRHHRPVLHPSKYAAPSSFTRSAGSAT